MLKEVKGKEIVLEAYLKGIPIMRVETGKEDEKQLNFGIAMNMTKILDAEFKEHYRFLIDVDEAKKPPQTRKEVPVDKPEKKKAIKDKVPDEEAGKERERIDEGKIKALHEAKWTNKQIADEMRISEGTVRKYIKKLHGEKKSGDPDGPGDAS